MVEAMKKVGVKEGLSTTEEFGRIIESEMNRWGKMVRSLNLQLEWPLVEIWDRWRKGLWHRHCTFMNAEKLRK